MKFITFNTHLTLAVYAVLFSGFHVRAAEMDDDCEYLNNIVTLVQKQINQLSTCANELNFGTAALRTSNYLCIVKCALNKVGVLNADGTIDVAGTTNYLDTSIPPAFKARSPELKAKCQEAASKIVPNDESCKSYEELVSCVLKSIASSLRSVVSETVSSGKISPAKLVKCSALGTRVEAELLKLDLQSFKSISA